jgi:hypothetical protein
MNEALESVLENYFSEFPKARSGQCAIDLFVDGSSLVDFFNQFLFIIQLFFFFFFFFFDNLTYSVGRLLIIALIYFLVKMSLFFTFFLQKFCRSIVLLINV